MKIYQVFHRYDTDGGFGDAIPQDDFIASFEDKNDAETFIKKFSNPHVYDSPYADLECGALWIGETEVILHSEFDLGNMPMEKYWWMD